MFAARFSFSATMFTPPLSIPIPLGLPLLFRPAVAAIPTSPFPKLSIPFPPLLPCRSGRLFSTSVGSVSTDAGAPVVVSDDSKYGRKQVISLTPPLYEYVLSNVREPQILRELREETSTMRGSQMQVSPDQAQLLAMLVQIMGAKKCIEVGIYTGYSSLAVALALPESGRLVACERDARCLEVAKKYYKRAGVSHKIDVRHALAIDALNSLILSGEANSFDFAFVDADKKLYNEYFELLFQLVRPGGLIIMDNVLWHGKVADPNVNDPKTVSIRNFNSKLLEDKRINISMVPIGDGMTICRKITDISAQQ